MQYQCAQCIRGFLTFYNNALYKSDILLIYLLTSPLWSVYCTVVIAVMSTASVVDNPLVIGGLLLAGFVIMMLLVGIAYIVVKSVL